MQVQHKCRWCISDIHHIYVYKYGCRRFLIAIFSLMPVVHLPPGILYCLRSSPFLIFPFSVFWILHRIHGQKDNSAFPSWLIAAAPLAVPLAIALGYNYFTRRAVKRHAAQRGAVMVPSVQENRISVSRRLVHGFETGCPGMLLLPPCQKP